MYDSNAVRLHNGDKTFIVNPKTREVVVKSRHYAAKNNDSKLAIWRKVCSKYLQKGEFTKIPKRGTKEHEELVAEKNKAFAEYNEKLAKKNKALAEKKKKKKKKPAASKK